MFLNLAIYFKRYEYILSQQLHYERSDEIIIYKNKGGKSSVKCLR